MFNYFVFFIFTFLIIFSSSRVKIKNFDPKNVSYSLRVYNISSQRCLSLSLIARVSAAIARVWHVAEDIAAAERTRRQVAPTASTRVFLVRCSAARRRRPIVTSSENYRAPSGTHNYIFDPGQINISQK